MRDNHNICFFLRAVQVLHRLTTLKLWIIPHRNKQKSYEQVEEHYHILEILDVFEEYFAISLLRWRTSNRVANRASPIARSQTQSAIKQSYESEKYFRVLTKASKTITSLDISCFPVSHHSHSVTRVFCFPVSHNNDSTRVTIFGDSSRVTFFTKWLDSSHNQWDSSQSHFYKISKHLIDKPSAFAQCTQRNELFLLQWLSILAKILQVLFMTMSPTGVMNDTF